MNRSAGNYAQIHACTHVMGLASLADNQELFTGINVIGTNVIKYKSQRPRIVLVRMTLENPTQTYVRHWYRINDLLIRSLLR